jgi:hypothetical protein
LTAGLGAGVYFGVHHEDQHWTPIYNQALSEVAHWKSDSQVWHQSASKYRNRLDDLQKQVANSVGSLRDPHFGLWNSCSAASPGCSLTPGYEYVGGVPDTFTYNVSFRSTVPVTVWIMTTSNFVCWETGACA